MRGVSPAVSIFAVILSTLFGAACDPCPVCAARWSGDFFFGRVLEFVPPFSNGMNASIVIGQQDFMTNGGSSGIRASQSNMNNVVGVAFGPACNL